MKRLIFITAMLIACQAHAGFITGLLVGHALSNGSQSGTAAPMLIGSADPAHSVIVCKKDYFKSLCETPAGQVDITPEAYAKGAGFAHVYSLGVAFANDHEYIVIEVSK